MPTGPGLGVEVEVEVEVEVDRAVLEAYRACGLARGVFREGRCLPGATVSPLTKAASAVRHSAAKSAPLTTFQKLAPTGGGRELNSFTASPQLKEWYMKTSSAIGRGAIRPASIARLNRCSSEWNEAKSAG